MAFSFLEVIPVSEQDTIKFRNFRKILYIYIHTHTYIYIYNFFSIYIEKKIYRILAKYDNRWMSS